MGLIRPPLPGSFSFRALASAGNSDAIPTPLSTAFIPAEGQKHWSEGGGDLYQQLPHRGKRYNYQTDQATRDPIPNRVGIEHRPAEADLKQQSGHFEIDTLFGKDQKSFLLTLVDKAVKLVIIRKLPNKRAETVVAAFRDIVADTFCEFKTLTADNGSEFSQHEEITKITGAPVYFARPYHSWERGLNEHTNGLIRRPILLQ
jgi:IS30 family transposase